MKNKVVLTSILFGIVLMGSSVLAQTEDVTPPSDIERAPVVSSVGDASVTLSWDVGVDNVAVTGYKVYYGTSSLVAQKSDNGAGRSEYESFVKVDNSNTTTIKDLQNGVKYYFSVTSLDAAGNESEFYSPEAEATPIANTVVENTNTNEPVITDKPVEEKKEEVIDVVSPLPTETVVETSSGTVLPTLEDVSQIVSKFEQVVSKYSVTLTWTLPKNVANIVSQIVYQSLDGNVFQQLASLAPNIETYTINSLNPGKYFFKITTKDKEGNESAGIVKVVELPATGPAMAALLLASLTAVGVGMKKKQK